MTREAAAQAHGLSVETVGGRPIVHEVDLRVGRREIVGLVGESGSGKTTTALALFGYTTEGLKRVAGDVKIAGTELRDEGSYRRARGRLISYVPQNPGTALSPARRIADAIQDMLDAHPGEGTSDAPGKHLERVGLPSTREFGRRFPHQLSGGQQQRVCIAVSLSAAPEVVVLDEPTTGLDVVTQDQLLKELVRLRDEEDAAMLYITHDLAVVAEIATRIAVMYAGRIVEVGPAAELLGRPRHPYTRGLVSATPDHLRPHAVRGIKRVGDGTGSPDGCAFAARCPQRIARCDQMPLLRTISEGHEVRCYQAEQTPELQFELLHVGNSPENRPKSQTVLAVETLRAEHRTRDGVTVAASAVSFEVGRGECVALVGESGSGKTTIARAIAGLHAPSAGTIRLDGQLLAPTARKRPREHRRRIQLVFQNPAEALNPRHTVGDAISRPMVALKGRSRPEARAETERLLEAVGLLPRMTRRLPRELSGGERQRVAIARALATEPDVMICDEITSALDVSVQAAVIELLNDLRTRLGVAMLFVTHDLGVVATIANRTLVLEKGDICEHGDTGTLLANPQHEYTKRLLAAAPSMSAVLDGWNAEARARV